MYRLAICAFLAVIGCGDSSSKKVSADDANASGAPPPKDAAAHDGSDSGGSVDSGKNEPQPAKLVPNTSDAPRPNYEEITKQACVMAGGSCSDEAQESGGAVISSIYCRPLGYRCVHVAGDCGPLISSGLCCFTGDSGKTLAGSVYCDRGYPTCPKAQDGWLSSGNCQDRTTELPLAASESDPSRWEGAVSVLEATRWACSQAGGTSIPLDASCDGTLLPFAKDGAERCCLTKAACPDAYVDTECCNDLGKVEAKGCVNGRAYCNEVFKEIGVVREVKTGTCAPFSPPS